MKITSYNCRGMKICSGSADPRNYIMKQVLDQTDILLVQETWCYKQDLAYINTYHNDFFGIGEATRDTNEGISVGRPNGGVAIFYRRKFGQNVREIRLGINWAIAVEIKVADSFSIIIVCVYMPFLCNENEDEFLSRLGVLSHTVRDFECPNVIIAGDFNANMSGEPSVFGSHLKLFCEENELSFSSIQKLPSDTYTYVSERWGSTSWLDHCICTKNISDNINNFEVLYNTSTFDHIPIKFNVEYFNPPGAYLTNGEGDDNECFNPSVHVKWENLTTNELVRYYNETENHLIDINNNYNIECSDPNCGNVEHRALLSGFYRNIVEKIFECTTVLMPSNRRKRNVRPGWNEYVKESHEICLEADKRWRDSGKPPQGNLMENKKITHSRYKNAVKFIKKNEESIRNNKMAENLLNNHSKDFWKDVKKLTKAKNTQANSIDGVVGSSEIANHWKKHYAEIYNSVPRQGVFAAPACDISDYQIITSEEVLNAIENLNYNKCCGPDKIAAENFRYCSPVIGLVLSQFFTVVLSHGFIPSEMLNATIKPIIKDPKGKQRLYLNWLEEGTIVGTIPY